MKRGRPKSPDKRVSFQIYVPPSLKERYLALNEEQRGVVKTAMEQALVRTLDAQTETC